MLGARGVDVLSWESFSKGWATDITQHLGLWLEYMHPFDSVRVLDADFGQLPDLSQVDCDRDVVFVWNGTTSGAKVPDGEWIAADREGLTICDATSAVFAMELPWGQTRCSHLLLAKGHGRRSRARDAHPQSTRGQTAPQLHATLARAQALQHDPGRPA